MTTYFQLVYTSISFQELKGYHYHYMVTHIVISIFNILLIIGNFHMVIRLVTNYARSCIAINNIQSPFGRNAKQMLVRLSTRTVSKISSLPDSTNAALMTEFYRVRKRYNILTSTEINLNTCVTLFFIFINFIDSEFIY
jgi:hypothetical protein